MSPPAWPAGMPTPLLGVEPRRELGRWGLTALGLSAIIGSGIYALPAAVAAATGTAGLVAYLCAAAAVLLFGHSLAILARRCDLTGGPYVYVEAVFGRFWGFQAGWFFFLARITALAAVSEAFILYLGAEWPTLGSGAGRAVAMSLCMGTLAVVNIVGIRATRLTMGAFAVGKVLPLVFFVLMGLSAFDGARVVPREFPAPVAFGHTVLLLVFAFGGFEFLTVPAEESRRPRDHVPFALLASIGITSVLYLSVQATAAAALPDLARHGAPLADAARRLAGRPGFAVMIAGALIATVGTLLAIIFVLSRVIYAFSRDGLLPAWLGQLDPRFRTPVPAVILSAGVGLVLGLGGTFVRMAAFSAAARLATYGACCAAALALRPESGSPESGSHKASPWLPAAGLAASLLLVGMLPPRDWLVAGGAVVLGVVIYVAGRHPSASSIR